MRKSSKPRKTVSYFDYFDNVMTSRASLPFRPVGSRCLISYRHKCRCWGQLTASLALAALSAGCERSRHPSYLVYVTNEASGDLTVIDPSQPTAVATIPLGKRPRGIHASGGLLYVTLSGS